MVTRNDMITYCLSMQGAKEDYPFEDIDKTILRHEDNRKWFALVFTLHGQLCINVKVSPFESDILCEQYQGIQKGWHMNKRHWITIDVNQDVDWCEIKELIKDSYQRTLPKKTGRKASNVV